MRSVTEFEILNLEIAVQFSFRSRTSEKDLTQYKMPHLFF